MRFFKKYWWLILISVVILTLLILNRTIWRGRPVLALSPFQHSKQWHTLTLSRGHDTLDLSRESENASWTIPSINRKVDPELIYSLSAYISAIELKFPVKGISYDSLTRKWQDSLLTIRVQNFAGKVSEVSLVASSKDHLLALLPIKRSAYQADIPGFSTDAIGKISLRPMSWANANIGVERPSELKSLTLIWRDMPKESFTIKMPPDLKAQLFPYLPSDSASKPSVEVDVAPIPYDTVRMSTFLHAMTTLRYLPQADTVTEKTLSQLSSTIPYYTLRMTLKNGDERNYSLYRISTINGKRDPNHAYLLDEQGKAHIIALYMWDDSMPLLQNFMK